MAGAGLLVLIVGTARVLARSGDLVVSVAAAAAAVSLATVWWRMRHLRLDFGPEGAAWGFGRVRRRAARHRIRTAEVESYRAARYMGWGYRLGWKPTVDVMDYIAAFVKAHPRPEAQ